jgi:transcriptional regulator with XRE-family HTH domain
MTYKLSSQWTRQHGTLLLAVSLAPSEVGKKIAQAREAKQWTQLEFASRANVSPSSVQRWEAGRLPPVRELLRVAEILGVEPETLVELPASDRPPSALLREVSGGIVDALEELRLVGERLGRIEVALGLPASEPGSARKGTGP